MTATQEQRGPDLALELLQAPTQGRLRDVQLAGRAGQRARAGDCHHELQIGSIHTGIVS
jgi:hypothetical protein